MKNIVREVISLPQMDVVKASYKNSVYYIAGSCDITDYVSTIKSSFEVTEIDAIEHGLVAFLRENPVKKVLDVPLYNVVILDNPNTSVDFVIQIANDIFRKDIDEAHVIADEVHFHGSSVVGTYNYELAYTFACMVETANLQTDNFLETDIVPVLKPVSSMDSLEVIEQLIRRDFPEDL